MAGVQEGDTFHRGIDVYGVPVGSEEFILNFLRKKKEEIIRDAEKTRELLSGDRQALWTALRLSISQRFSYLQQHVQPSLCSQVAEELDQEIWRIFEAACGFPVPRGNQRGGLQLQVPAIPSLDGKSFQEWVVRLPACHYGWGLRSLKETCSYAYLGMLETALPSMTGEGGVCPALAVLYGGQECWGEEASPETRWRTVLSSGCTVGQEVQEIWRSIQEEARQASNFLGQEVPAVLSIPVEGIGGDTAQASVSGETRGRVVRAVEGLRVKVLSKVLKELRPQKTRAAWAWRQRDKVSSAWTQAIPGPDTSLSSAEFAEAAAANLVLPSPACESRVGETIRGRVKVDEYGDNVQATAVKGDHWRTRHNAFLYLVKRQCMWAGQPCELEVRNLFAGEMRQPGLSRAERDRQLQAIVPDARITMPAATGARGDGEGERERARVGAPGGAGLAGQSSAVLHECKVISCSRSRYKPTWTKRAVDVRTAQLPKEYLDKAKAADRRQGVAEGVVGRVEAKLVSLGELRGIVAGNFGEVSTDTHDLIAALATRRVRKAGVERGRRGMLRSEEAERAIAITGIRRRFGVMAVRCQASSLLGRLETLGPGGAAAVGRRWQAAELERQWRREEQAHSLATQQGYSYRQRGFSKDD